MSGLVLLVPTWNCWISYKNGYARLLVLNSLLFLNPWFIVEKDPAYVFSIGITLVDVHLSWLSWFYFLISEGGLRFILIDWMIFLSPFLKKLFSIYNNVISVLKKRKLSVLKLRYHPFTYKIAAAKSLSLLSPSPSLFPLLTL